MGVIKMAIITDVLFLTKSADLINQIGAIEEKLIDENNHAIWYIYENLRQLLIRDLIWTEKKKMKSKVVKYNDLACFIREDEKINE